MNYLELSDHAKLALDSLRFFSLDGEQQIAICEDSLSESAPSFFSEAEEDCRLADHLVGIGCVYWTYKSSLLNEMVGERGLDDLEDFSHRLAVLMNEKCIGEWDSAAVLHGVTWQKLRKDAKRAVTEMGVVLGDALPIPRFDIEELTNPDDFRDRSQV